MHLFKFKLLPFVLVLLFSIQSCAEMQNWVSSRSPVKKSAPVKHTSQTSGQASAQAVILAQKHMKAGEYQEVINIYNNEYREQPQDLSLMKEYVKSLDEIKSTADTALEKGDRGSAGRLYYALHNNYSKFNGFEQRLSFNKDNLNTKLTYCKKNLARQGFEEYRKGNLDKAIVLWQELLAIDPNNNDINEAVRTATQQQKNLQGKN